MANQSQHDVWAAGTGYEAYVGRWSRLVAREFLAWLAVPAGGRWLDVGCGTGALTAVILELSAPHSVVGIDQSHGFLAHGRAQVSDKRVAFARGDAQSLPVSANTCDAAVSGLALNFVPAPNRAAAELRRAVRPGGAVAAYVWDYAGEMQFMRRFWDAAAALDPAARELDEGLRFPLCRPEPLAGLFREAGLQRVATRPIDVPTVFRNFDDFWSPFLGGQGPAPGYVASLSADKQVALREDIRGSLPFEADGSIRLIARAWAVRGVAQGAQ